MRIILPTFIGIAAFLFTSFTLWLQEKKPKAKDTKGLSALAMMGIPLVISHFVSVLCTIYLFKL